MPCNHSDCRLHNQKAEEPAMFGTFVAPMTDGTVHFQITPLNPADMVEPYHRDPDGTPVAVNAGTIAFLLTPDQALAMAEDLAKQALAAAHVQHHRNEMAMFRVREHARRN